MKNQHLFAVMPPVKMPQPFYVQRIGFHIALTSDHPICFPDGISSYHALFCVRGVIRIGEQELKSGWGIIIPSQTPYEYTYMADSDSLYIWIIFEGTELEAFFKRHGESFAPCSLADKMTEIEALARQIFCSSQLGISCLEDYNAGLLYALLTLTVTPPKAVKPFQRATEVLRGKTERSIRFIAAMYGMNAGYFSEAFRDCYGVPPSRFRLLHKLSEAEFLLETSTLTVAEIAESCGFKDPFYFSRAFKKQYGKSPSEYRKSSAEG